MLTFVHNEPTSLAIIQELGLPSMFYQAIENDIELAIGVCKIPSCEESCEESCQYSFTLQVIQAIPNGMVHVA